MNWQTLRTQIQNPVIARNARDVAESHHLPEWLVPLMTAPRPSRDVEFVTRLESVNTAAYVLRFGGHYA
ncbi:MAG: hypothetical protein KGL39_37750 [Patescibacteria group bacterium]|nr:hypothetical protein [Patescibacteria group bacterium]